MAATHLQEKTSKKDKKRKQPEPSHDSAALLRTWHTFEEEEMLDAQFMIAEEVELVREAMGHTETTQEEYKDAWATAVRDFIYLPMQHKYGRAASATNTDRLDSVRGEYHMTFDLMKKEAERASKIESKVALVTKGLVNREENLQQELADLTEKVQSAANDVVAFQTLSVREQRAAPLRRAALQSLVQQQRDREQKLQNRYRDLLHEKDMLLRSKTAEG